MGETTGISWTNHTMNPWIGCVEVSPACDHCYARTMATGRMGLKVWGKDADRHMTSDSYWKQPFKWNRDAGRSGERRRVFCGSMCDVMEERPGVDGEELQKQRVRLYSVIQETPWLDWLLLTKRPQNFRRFLPASWLDNQQPNVWLLTTVESPEYMWRVKELCSVRAVVHGISYEPALGPIASALAPYLGDRRIINWVIAGGESGGAARPAHPEWFRSLRDQCQAAGVAFHFKQHGEWLPARVTETEGNDAVYETIDGSSWPHQGKIYDNHEWDDGFGAIRVGKHAAGRLLDGRTWDEFPNPAA